VVFKKTFWNIILHYRIRFCQSKMILNYFDLSFLFLFIVNFLVFIFGIGGLFATRRNLIIIFVCIELILLSAFLNFSFFSVYVDDLLGVLFSLFILGLAAAESSIGLALLVVNYRHKAIVSVDLFSILKS
jgi:NADH-quinone oxidoreductase subunit K